MKNGLKFSIVIPVYNTEKYLSKNIESIINQSYENFEVIYVNDGSKDKSLSILRKYQKKDKRIIVIDKENTGVSDTRNTGVKDSKGDYLCFVDSDDYLEKNFLKKLYGIINTDNNPDIIGISFDMVDEDGNILDVKNSKIINNKNGREAFEFFVNNSYMIDIPWVFVYNKKYWDKNKYKFLVGTFHEDFGLIPEIVIKANTVSTSDAIYYYLINRKGSTMSNLNKDFILRKANDALINYDGLCDRVLNNNFLSKKYKIMFRHYIDNSVIGKLSMLDGKNYKEYKTKLKERGIYNIFNSGNFKIFIKKIILNINLNLYLKIVRQYE